MEVELTDHLGQEPHQERLGERVHPERVDVRRF